MKTPFADTSLASLKRVRTPKLARWFARVLLLGFVVMPFVLVFVPWQQTVRGRGQIVAFAPTERRQVVTSRIDGQIGRWHVAEGSRVKSGDPLVDINDNDAEFGDRLENQRKFLYSRKRAAQEEIAEQTVAVEAQEKALSASVKAAKANRIAAVMLVDVGTQARTNAEFASGYEKRRFGMFEKMFKGQEIPGFKGREIPGLVAELERDEALVRADRAATDVKRAEAEIERSKAGVLTSDSLILQAEATGVSTVATTRRDLRRAEQNAFGVERELQEIDTRIERFKARFVKSPCDGIVFRISANVGEGGSYVKQGEELAVIVPDTDDRVVELLIDGMDAPLIAAHMEQMGRGPHVRLQFEGWPAVQFAGWPSVAVGTFGGKVRQIDATDDGYGKFRILVEPEEAFDGDRWPEGAFIRQGNQAVGWVFLNRVTLGYELWRQFNGFPPVVAPKAPDKKDAKPPKVKPG